MAGNDSDAEWAELGTEYYLRGKGMVNIAIGFIRDGKDWVWRINIEHLLTSINSDDTKENAGSKFVCLLQFIDRIISPLFQCPQGNSHFLVIPRLVLLRGHQLREIDSKWRVFSSIPDQNIDIDRIGLGKIVTALEMPDFSTFLPRPVTNPRRYPVIGVEIKPKRGFMPDDIVQLGHIVFGNDSGDRMISYCVHCLAQYEKASKTGEVNQINKYCPLDLYSGDVRRMRRAVMDQLARRTRLRLFKDGRTVYDKNNPFPVDQIDRLLLGDQQHDSIDFVDYLVRILRYSPHSTDTNGHQLPKGCILDTLLVAQKLETCGPLETANLIRDLQSMDGPISDLTDAYSLFLNDFSSYNTETRSKMAQLRASLICATLQDCSIMITMQATDIPPIVDHNSTDHCQFRPIRISDPLWLNFNINVIDLDGKTPARAMENSKRYVVAMNMMQSNYANGAYHREPCVLRK